MSVIKAPFGFLEVGKEGIGADASQSGQTGIGVMVHFLSNLLIRSYRSTKSRGYRRFNF
jgi:hypothetical protein